MKRLNRVLLAAIACLFIFGTAGVTHAAPNRSWVWTRWDVKINNIDTRQNSFHVEETQEITVIEGSFAGGDRSVALDRVTSVDNVRVLEDGTPLPLNSARSADTCTDMGVFCLLTGNNEVDMYYNFTARTYAGQTHIMTLAYDVHGALRSYAAGDQLWWSPVAGIRDFPVLASRVTIEMPPSRSLLPDTNTSTNWVKRVEGNTVTFDSTGRIGPNDLAEISVTYMHDPVMPPPPWQADLDSKVAMRPFVFAGLVIFTVLWRLVN